MNFPFFSLSLDQCRIILPLLSAPRSGVVRYQERVRNLSRAGRSARDWFRLLDYFVGTVEHRAGPTLTHAWASVAMETGCEAPRVNAYWLLRSRSVPRSSSPPRSLFLFLSLALFLFLPAGFSSLPLFSLNYALPPLLSPHPSNVLSIHERSRFLFHCSLAGPRGGRRFLLKLIPASRTGLRLIERTYRAQWPKCMHFSDAPACQRIAKKRSSLLRILKRFAIEQRTNDSRAFKSIIN